MKVFSWILSALIGLVVVLLGFVYLLPGFDLFVVQSDSMQPTFGAGDLVVIVPPGFLGRQVRVGEIISYERFGSTITHRVVQVDGENIVTKGDANDDADVTPVSSSKVVGVYLMEIPHLGYFTAFIRTRPGWFVSIVVPALLLVGWLVIDIVREAFRLEREPVNEPDYSTFLQEKNEGGKPSSRLARFLLGAIKGPAHPARTGRNLKPALKKARAER
jgi:signal peptidase I